MLKTLLTTICMAATLGALPALADETPLRNGEVGVPFRQASPARQATLTIAGKPVLTVVPVGMFSANDRIADVQRRLIRFLQIEKPNAFAARPVGVEGFDTSKDMSISWASKEPYILYKGVPLVTITTADARAQNTTVALLAEKVLRDMRAGMAYVTPQANNTLANALSQVAVQTGDRSYSAADQALDEGS